MSPKTPLKGPRAHALAPDGNLWLALREGNAVYRIDMKSATLHHIAGTGKPGFTGNGGPAIAATIAGPKGAPPPGPSPSPLQPPRVESRESCS